jgi:ferredoxin
LSFETEPYWEVKGEWNNPGHKAWFEDSVKCRNYWYEVGTNCGICFAVCPWASNNLASYHNMRNMLAATVPAFNSTLVSMDNLLHTPYTEFGKPQKDPELWWKQDLPVYGIDTTMSIKSV